MVEIKQIPSGEYIASIDAMEIARSMDVKAVYEAAKQIARIEDKKIVIYCR